MLVGLSASKCILDIAEERVDAEFVTYILSAIGYGTLEEAEKDGLIKRYRETYWRKAPDLCESIFRLLYNKGRIIFLRGNSEVEVPLLITASFGHWLEAQQVGKVEEVHDWPRWSRVDDDTVNYYIPEVIEAYKKWREVAALGE